MQLRVRDRKPSTVLPAVNSSLKCPSPSLDSQQVSETRWISWLAAVGQRTLDVGGNKWL